MSALRVMFLISAFIVSLHYLYSQEIDSTPIYPLVQVDEELTVEEVMLEIGNIYFDSGSYDLDRKSEMKLTRLSQVLNDHQILEILIVAHADCRGSELYNKVLSEKRGEIVMLFLETNKISRNRIYLEAFGEEKPKNKCIDNVSCDDVLHLENRRVEFVVFSD